MEWLADLDHAGLHWINSHHNAVADWILVPVSLLGEMGAVWVLVGLGLIIFGRGRARRTGLILLAAMLVADRLLGWPLGLIVSRGRPYVDEPDLRQIGFRWSSESFPSAHAYTVVVAAIVLGSEYRRLVPALVIFVLLTLYSRPYLGMHYPLDALAGAGVGAVVGVAALALRRRWENEPRESA